jgi:hypothetical protein
MFSPYDAIDLLIVHERHVNIESAPQKLTHGNVLLSLSERSSGSKIHRLSSHHNKLWPLP